MTDRPALHVVRGEPTAEELAVLTAVVTAAGGGDEAPEPPRRGRWNDPARQHRTPLRPGPGAWRASF
jgi:hypothetical protein